jgi:hypothetical protein
VLAEEENEELIAGHQEIVTNENLQELIKSYTEDEQKRQQLGICMNLLVSQAAKHFNDLISDYDPCTERCLRITRGVMVVMKPYH